MPVIYQCDRAIWKPGEQCHAIATSLVAQNPAGQKWLVPAPHWRLIDVGHTVAILCPGCGEECEKEQEAEKAKLPKVAGRTEEARKLGMSLLDGGRGLQPANDDEEKT